MNTYRKYIITFYFLIICTVLVSCNTRNNLNIHFIDIGQGDSSLIQYKNINILIDSGPNDSEEKLIRYLKKYNVKRLDYLIATHPHEDHIGNMDAILDEFDVKKFLAPYVEYESSDFDNMIRELKEKNMTIQPIDASSNKLFLESNTYLEFLHPTNITYENTNNYSLIIKLNHFSHSFLFTGDAELEAELSLLKNNFDLKSDILKVAHHGSSSSSSLDFLNAVNPSISIISCGINNKFKHPHISTLQNLESINSKIYRTDEDGSLILESDGKKIIKK